MSPLAQQAVLDAIATVRELPRRRHDVVSARRRFEQLKLRHPDILLSLLVDVRPGAEAADYDILVGVPDAGTIALSWYPDDGTPWTPLHAAHWAANFVLTVDGASTSIQSALIYLNGVLNRRPDLMENLVNRLLIDAAIKLSPPPVSDEEVEAAVDEFRVSQGLYGGTATQRWLDETGLTMDALRELNAERVQVRKFQESITAEGARPYFDAHKRDFDVVRVFRVKTPSRADARAVTKAAQESGLLAVLSGDDARFAELNGVLETRYSRDLPEFAEASMNAIIGSERSDNGFRVGQLLQRRAARFDRATRTRIEELLFAEWLSARRQEAKVEWHWM